jgi:hypothetical protein
MLVAGLAYLFMGHFADAGVLLGCVCMVGSVLHMRRERQKGRDFLLWLQAEPAINPKRWSRYQGR